MQNILLYLGTVLSWGSTWYAIKFQLGIVSPDVSIGYRFILASFVLFCWCFFRGLNLQFSLKNHLFLISQGIFLFSLNYLCLYWATNYLASGLNAVVFSTIMIFNIINSAIFYRTSVNLSVVVGAILGICGIAIIFWPQLSTLDFSSSAMMGMMLGLAGAGSASWGNMLSARNQKNHLPVMESNAYAMAYGGLFTFILAFIQGVPITFDWSVSYVGSLFYLSFLGSIVAFGCYLTLLGRIGASKAAYALLLTPVVALVISTIFEDFSWSDGAIVGVGFIFLGNILVLLKKSPRNTKLSTTLDQSLKDAA